MFLELHYISKNPFTFKTCLELEVVGKEEQLIDRIRHFYDRCQTCRLDYNESQALTFYQEKGFICDISCHKIETTMKLNSMETFLAFYLFGG